MGGSCSEGWHCVCGDIQRQQSRRPVARKSLEMVADWDYSVVSIGYPGPVLRGRPISDLITRGRWAMKADAQKFVKMIIGDKAKSQIYCDIVKLGEQIEETDPTDTKKTDEMYQRADELATKLGPEYIALMNGLQDMDPDSEEGKDIGSTLDVLNKLCAK